MTVAPLGVPSMHLIGEKDPARPQSEATVTLYSAAPTAATQAVYRGARASADASGDGAATAEGPSALSFREEVVHPNDHMPPRQKESAQALYEFAERWSPRQRAS